MELNEQTFKSELSRVFKENGLGSLLNLDRSEKFFALTKRMLSENEKYNLTAITDPEKIILNHYADCVTLSAKLPKGARIIDVGCGAGFPTLPLAIVREDIKILAVDSTAKRISYVEETARMLSTSVPWATATKTSLPSSPLRRMPAHPGSSSSLTSQPGARLLWSASR